ncbi:MAG: arginine--tRNA ligase [Bacilli bacterium]
MEFKIEEILECIYESLGYKGYNIVSPSSRVELCDYQINTCFSISKSFHISPTVIGEKIVNEIKLLDNFNDYFKSVEFFAPGFINITVSDKFICDNNMLLINDLGISKNNSQKYFLDYGGANVAKPLHIGHIRPAIIGESLKRILKLKGNTTISDVHLGDYGLQIGEVIFSCIRDKKQVEDITLEYLSIVYPLISAECKDNEETLNVCKNITLELQLGNQKYQEYFKKICDVSIKDIKEIYDYLGVSFDLWLGESDSYDVIPELISILEGKGLVSLSEGAKVINIKKLSDTKEYPPLILQKSDNAYLYATTDLACVLDRKNKYNPDYILYVVDARQSLHFEQVFRVCEMSGISKSTSLEHIAFGTINGLDGKPFKTRSGETLKLRELFSLVREEFISKREENKNLSEKDLDIIVNSIIKFADLQNNREKNYIFDISKFSDVSGKTGPYIEYTALRIRKILNENKPINDNLGSFIENKYERDLRIKLFEFDKVLNNAVEERSPHFIAEYVYNLCNLVNSFYENNRISTLEDEVLKSSWINLLALCYKYIEVSLELLLIDIPSKM